MSKRSRRHARTGDAVPPPPGQRPPARPRPAGGRMPAIACRDHRRRRHRYRARPSCTYARGRILRSDRIDAEKDIKITRSRPRTDPAGPPERLLRNHDTLRKLGVDAAPRHASPRLPAWGPSRRRQLRAIRAGGLAAGVKGPDVLANLDGLKPAARTSRRHADPADHPRPDICPRRLRLAGARRSTRPLPPRAQTAHQQATHFLGQIRCRLRAALRPFVTATSARWSHWVTIRPWAA
jgi:hypothetical protein